MAQSCLGDSSNYASSSGLKRLKQFPLPVFPRDTPSTKPWNRGGATSYRGAQFRGQTSYRPSRPFRGRGRATATFSQSTPSKPVRSPPAGTGMSLELSLKPTVSNHITGGTYQMRRTFVFLGSRWPRPLTSGNAHAFRCNVSKWRTGLRESDPWVLKTVAGCKIEFLESLRQSYIPTMHASEEERDLKDQEVLSLSNKNVLSTRF